MNIEVEAASSNVETRCEGINKDCRDLEIHETMFANSEETQNISTASKIMNQVNEMIDEVAKRGI